jgi:hypothetical protein
MQSQEERQRVGPAARRRDLIVVGAGLTLPKDAAGLGGGADVQAVSDAAGGRAAGGPAVEEVAVRAGALGQCERGHSASVRLTWLKRCACPSEAGWPSRLQVGSRAISNPGVRLERSLGYAAPLVDSARPEE